MAHNTATYNSTIIVPEGQCNHPLSFRYFLKNTTVTSSLWRPCSNSPATIRTQKFPKYCRKHIWCIYASVYPGDPSMEFAGSVLGFLAGPQDRQAPRMRARLSLGWSSLGQLFVALLGPPCWLEGSCLGPCANCSLVWPGMGPRHPAALDPYLAAAQV